MTSQHPAPRPAAAAAGDGCGTFTVSRDSRHPRGIRLSETERTTALTNRGLTPSEAAAQARSESARRLTAHPEYAFTRRQGARSNARYHAVLDQPLTADGYSRQAADALCRLRRQFWGLAPGNPAATVNCPRCLELAGRYGVILPNSPSQPAPPEGTQPR